jgi:hypothetical protein
LYGSQKTKIILFTFCYLYDTAHLVLLSSVFRCLICSKSIIKISSNTWLTFLKHSINRDFWLSAHGKHTVWWFQLLTSMHNNYTCLAKCFGITKVRQIINHAFIALTKLFTRVNKRLIDTISKLYNDLDHINLVIFAVCRSPNV